MVEDWFAVFLLYPAAAVQMDEQMEAVENQEYNKKNDISMTTNGPYMNSNSNSHPHLNTTKSGPVKVATLVLWSDGLKEVTLSRSDNGSF